ncbi:MAG: hypothetical protein WCI47_01370 [bacterium]
MKDRTFETIPTTRMQSFSLREFVAIGGTALWAVIAVAILSAGLFGQHSNSQQLTVLGITLLALSALAAIWVPARRAHLRSVAKVFAR